jgi:PIN domain nuclease of toxin-antitoxin system
VKLLVDTHILVWLVEGATQLKPRARQAVDRAAKSDGLVVSAISFWEVAMLAARGRISLARPLSHWRELVLALPGIAEEPVTGDIGIEAVQLPGDFHADPADRLLVATCRLRGHRLGTHDGRILDYGRGGHLDVLAL